MRNDRGYFPPRWGWLLLAALLFLTVGGRSWAAESQPDQAVKQLMPMAGGALVHAGQKDWTQAARDLEQFEAHWKALNAPASALADGVNAALAEAKQALPNAESSPDLAYQAFSNLTKATDAYVAAQESPGSKADGKAAASSLLPVLQQCLDAVHQEQFPKARSAFKRFDSQWSKVEAAIRSDNTGVYGDIETKMSLARIALQAEPPKAEAAAAGITDLMKTIEDYAKGKVHQPSQDAGQHTINDALLLLQKAQEAVRAGQHAAAAEQMQAFIRLWPSVEGAVQTRAPDVYTRIETQMTEAAADLQSSPPKGEAASAVIAAMQAELEPFRNAAGYSAWDAALILLREGMEALLVLAALLAFLHRSNNASKQKWVWSGAAAGLAASGALAILLTYLIAGVAAGSTRELLEGITGLASVVMMLTVGVWLHGKSQMAAWNQYIHQQVGVALASGNLWSLFLVAGLAILREGAETTIFYIGIAPSIEPVQLVIGIAGAMAVLVLVGYAMVKGSVRLPVRQFFLLATLLIYYLVFKFLGQSVHALQVAGSLSAHPVTYLPTWSWLGVYPTWESAVPQLVVLVFIVVQMIRTEQKGMREQRQNERRLPAHR
ncbi:FTR1 family iron permease [Brevibacillus sp. SYP-B805]|uniref:FTR1 family iron permease n=1 Tax=Brevibacillus sp. SYP-B805 TaxID=1578199 RepID=UPI0013E9A0DC|nr:FTR1 family protein [Brevibacillus sp. SYP-B805]NGQ94960.1 FTR1 family iron permease [Brevibacillus sp. SYP-B805]